MQTQRIYQQSQARVFLKTVALTSSGWERRRAEKQTLKNIPRLCHYRRGCVTKGAAAPGRRLGTSCGPQSGNIRGLGPVTPASRGELTQRPLTPPPREVQLLRTTKQNKGVRREEGAALPSSHRCLPGPPAAPRPGGRWPRTKARAAPGPLSPRGRRVTGAGEAAEGRPGMGKPDGSIPPPSSSILPSGCPRPGRPPQGPGEASGPARPGSPQGKGCLCLKVTTRARCPGWAWCLPFPGRGGGDGGPPQISGGDRGKAPLPPPPTPRNGPLRDQPASGGGGQLLSLLGGGGPSQLLSLFRGGGEGETQWPPSASIPSQPAGGPVSSRHPQEG